METISCQSNQEDLIKMEYQTRVNGELDMVDAIPSYFKSLEYEDKPIVLSNNERSPLE